MKKVCIATYCEWNSYGSIMQSIGLKKALESLGCNSFIVKDNCAPAPTKRTPLLIGKNPKKIIINTYNNMLRKKTDARYRKAVEFINDNVDVMYYDNYEALKKNPPKADYYIAGSDQIWHPDLCKPLFFLDFLNSDARRLSYAASMGVTNIKPEKEMLFSSLVKGISSVSVRENEMVTVIGNYTQKNINVHIDPTFLLDADEWRTFEESYPIEKPYILVYAIYWDRKLNKELKRLHKKSGCNIVALCGGFSTVWANKKIFDASPGQFIWLVDNAEAVISSSFHGVAFALNFNKKLCSVINPKAPSRICSILDKLQMENCEIKDVLNSNISIYAKTNEIIKCERALAMAYLKELLDE